MTWGRLACAALLALTVPRVTSAQRPTVAAAARPNIVLIMTDDMGYSDIGPYGATDVRTPHLDRLAREGTRFTQFYASAVFCSPTRAALITGRYPQRVHFERPLSGVSVEYQGLDATPTSLPRVLRDAGYATALVGKWHLGYTTASSPLAHGFDWFWGLKSGYHDYYAHTDGAGLPDLFENDTPITADGYSTDLIASQAVRFIERNVARPFFLDVAFNAPHWPYQRPDAPSAARDKARHLTPTDSAPGTREDYVAMVERMDRGVGDILRALDRLGLARTTIVVFTNDNGGEWLARNAPLFNRKYTVWEGGIRVPAIVRWPGRVPAGRVTTQVGVTMDLAASFVAVGGASVPARYEGMNLFPVLEGRAPLVERTLFWRAPSRNQRAVRKGNIKLVRDANNDFVFDVAHDLGERHDLANVRQAEARALSDLLTAWEADVAREAGPAPQRPSARPTAPPATSGRTVAPALSGHH